MTTFSLAASGLRHFWRIHLAVVAGVATAVAVLAGALLVGDSVRGSLRDLVLQRLGRVDRAVIAADFFREALADDLRADRAAGADTVPLIAIPALASNEETGARASRVQVYGVDDRFWRLQGADRNGPADRDAFLSVALAAEIGAAEGSTVLIRIERPTAVPIESLHGRKDNLGRSLRLTVRHIVSPADAGDFSLIPNQGAVRAVFVPLRRLQQDLDVAGRVNALLARDRSGDADGDSLAAAIRRHFTLEDVGLRVRNVPGGVVAVEGAAGLIDDGRARAIDAAARGAAVQPVLTYLANAIRSGDREVPYSLVSAIDLRTIGGNLDAPAPGSTPPIVLNEWAARDLAVGAGAPITLDYYVWEDPGRLATRSAEFRVAAVIPIAGAAANPDLAPAYPGISDAKRLGDWDPPFPIDLARIRPADEAYWDRYRTTPKAFVALEDGQRLWASRFGDRTSVRWPPAPGESPSAARDRIADAIRASIDPAAFGLAVRNVRAEGLAASRGATDFAEYFTYFSFFLVVSALMLAALFFRLGIEGRAKEIGLLRSVGYTTARVRNVFLAEGAILAAIGSIIGAGGAVAYGGLMMAGLRSWWSGAVGTSALHLHVSAVSLGGGAAATMIAAMLCIWWTLRSLSRVSERRLLTGSIAAASSIRSSGRLAAAAAAFAIAGVVLIALGFSQSIDRTGAFFGAGAALLIACLCAAAVVLRRPPRSTLSGTGPATLWRVGARNAADRPGRSVLAIGVIASATFILIAVDAFRRTGAAPTDRRSGVGGYSLAVDLLVPLATDANGRDGREALGIDSAEHVSLAAFRVLPGDDASCLNLYTPVNPRILGVPAALIAEGRFAFQRSLATTDAERANPWLLLNADLGEGVVPAIADANSLTYVLHRAVGDEIVVSRGGGPMRLKIVGALSDSIFQRELLIADAQFTRLFPDRQGFRFLLVDAPAADAARIASGIENTAADLGADAESTAARLAEFHTVENTYLSTFQTLGGLGLLVGTVGLAAVILRNILERRRELALLGAVGYRRGHLIAIVLAENLLLLAWGLGIGLVCAVVAILPAMLERGGTLPAPASSALLLFGVLMAGLLSSVIATRAALRAPLLAALRSE
jgi:ABC-type lipoprotein release transport system permease subunit